MEDFLIVILQGLIELLVEAIVYIPFDWPFGYRSIPQSSVGIVGRCALWFVSGCLLAGGSLLVLNHTWISLPAFRIANIVLAPITSGYIAKFLAVRRSRKNPDIIPENHFRQAFWFTLGLVLIRFVYAVRQ